MNKYSLFGDEWPEGLGAKLYECRNTPGKYILVFWVFCLLVCFGLLKDQLWNKLIIMYSTMVFIPAIYMHRREKKCLQRLCIKDEYGYETFIVFILIGGIISIISACLFYFIAFGYYDWGIADYVQYNIDYFK